MRITPRRSTVVLFPEIDFLRPGVSHKARSPTLEGWVRQSTQRADPPRTGRRRDSRTRIFIGRGGSWPEDRSVSCVSFLTFFDTKGKDCGFAQQTLQTTMNIFRFFGDMSHTASILVLLLKLRASKSAAGESSLIPALFCESFAAPHTLAAVGGPSTFHEHIIEGKCIFAAFCGGTQGAAAAAAAREAARVW